MTSNSQSSSSAKNASSSEASSAFKAEIRAPKCDDYEVYNNKPNEWRLRVVMSRLPGEPLDAWISRAQETVRVSPRSGRFWRDFAESNRLVYRLLHQLSPTFERLE